jgi:hypothetical protein
MGNLITNAFGAITGALIIVWVGMIMWVTSPKERLARACAPVIWVGKLGTSIAMVSGAPERSIHGVQVSFDNTYYGCQFSLWRVFYEEDWKLERAKAAQKQKELEEAANAQQPPKAAPPKPLPY